MVVKENHDRKKNSIRKFNLNKKITLIRKMQLILPSPEAKSNITLHDSKTTKMERAGDKKNLTSLV